MQRGGNNQITSHHRHHGGNNFEINQNININFDENDNYDYQNVEYYNMTDGGNNIQTRVKNEINIGIIIVENKKKEIIFEIWI